MEAHSNPATFRSLTGCGLPPFFSLSSSPPTTASSPGRPFFFSPSSDFLFFGAGHAAPALPFSPPFSLSTYSSPAIPIGPASPLTATAFSFRSLRFSFSASVFLERAAQLFRSQRAALSAAIALLAAATLWNAGLMFQWGSHLIPARGPVSFSEIVHNQFFVVPRQRSAALQRYLFKRKALMKQIENRDLQQLEKNPPPP